jgi:hypothetical protein
MKRLFFVLPPEVIADVLLGQHLASILCWPGKFEHPEFYKSFLNNTANFFRGDVFLIKVVGRGYVYMRTISTQ